MVVIEGGVPGGSARHHAGQRRATADRLTLEANWLETIAADQATMREVLAKLPASYAIMHDLNVPGSKGTIDHVIIGPGGAFIVVSRRYGEHIDYRDGQLWAGDRSMKSVLEGARVESELMTQTLATPVVPVLALLDTLLPAATPSVVDGVLVTAEDNVVRVITRGAHTLLGPDKVYDITQRAMPMLHTPGAVERIDGATGAPVAVPDRGMRLPSPDPMSGQVAARPAATPVARVEPAIVIPAARGTVARQRRSAWGIGAVIVGLCLLAVAVGSIVRLVWTDDKSDTPDSTVASSVDSTTPDDSTTTDDSSTSEVSTTVAPTAPPTTAVMNAYPAPLVQYTAICPVPGGGWELVPTWPGDIPDLAEYDVEMLITDSWVSLASWKNAAEETSAILHGQPANASYTIRISAVLVDGSRSTNTPTPVTAPATDC